ncbi:unnamed protein product, partial [marine sediment metagenome]
LEKTFVGGSFVEGLFELVWEKQPGGWGRKTVA